VSARKRFWVILAAIMVVGFGIRVAYVVVAKSGPCRIENNGVVIGTSPSKCMVGDELVYNGDANFLAAGHGFNDPYYALTHPGAKPPPAADHPPLTVMVLAPVSWLSSHPPLSWIVNEPLDDHVREHRYTMVVLGTFLLLLVGLLGRRIGGDAVGLTAAGIAAVLPTIWVNDGLVMSETVTAVCVVGALLCALACWDSPSVLRAAALGGLCGLAALARAELVLFVPLLALVVPLTTRRPGRERAKLAACSVVVAGLVIAPWVGFNLVRFHDPTFISTNDGIALAGSNCAQVYYGSGIGLTNLSDCLGAPPPGDQSQAARVYRKRAFDYISAHKSRVPIVVMARIGRTWSVFRPGDMITFNVNEDREQWVTRLGLVGYYPTLIAAIGGAVLLWRTGRRRELWALLVPAIAITIGVAVTYGQTRFRAAAEPSLAVMAAVALVALVRWVRRPAVRDVEAPDAPPVPAA
jgi:4-amino-4-deoxy-L-arabinose transferase-like glycosyltransferase